MSTQTRNPAGSFAGGKATGGQFAGSTNDEADIDAFNAGYAQALADTQREAALAAHIAWHIGSDAQEQAINEAATNACEDNLTEYAQYEVTGHDAYRGKVGISGYLCASDFDDHRFDNDMRHDSNHIINDRRTIEFATDRDGDQRIGVELTDEERLVVGKAFFPTSWMAGKYALDELDDWEIMRLAPQYLVLDHNSDFVGSTDVNARSLTEDSDLSEDDLEIIEKHANVAFRTVRLAGKVHERICDSFNADAQYVNSDEWVAEQTQYAEDTFDD